MNHFFKIRLCKLELFPQQSSTSITIESLLVSPMSLDSTETTGFEVHIVTLLKNTDTINGTDIQYCIVRLTF